MLRSKSSRLAEHQDEKKMAVQIQGFDKVPGRGKPSPFQVHKIRDAHVMIDYDNRKDVVLAQSARTVFNKEKDKRLSELFKQPEYAKEEGHNCKKHSPTNNEHIRTAKDLQSARKTFHSLNFDKQTSRPFDESLRKMSI